MPDTESASLLAALAAERERRRVALPSEAYLKGPALVDALCSGQARLAATNEAGDEELRGAHDYADGRLLAHRRRGGDDLGGAQFVTWFDLMRALRDALVQHASGATAGRSAPGARPGMVRRGRGPACATAGQIELTGRDRRQEHTGKDAR
jgi:hypothetical protein